MTKSHNWKSNDIYNYNNNRQAAGVKRKPELENTFIDPHVIKTQKIEIPNSDSNSEENLPVILDEESVEIPVMAVKEESTDIKCEPASGKFKGRSALFLICVGFTEQLPRLCTNVIKL